MIQPDSPHPEPPTPSPASVQNDAADSAQASAVEIGGRESGLDPTRYGDWEKNGRCIDF